MVVSRLNRPTRDGVQVRYGTLSTDRLGARNRINVFRGFPLPVFDPFRNTFYGPDFEYPRYRFNGLDRPTRFYGRNTEYTTSVSNYPVTNTR